MNEIYVSIVIPIYNVEDYIEKTLKSLKKQTYKDLEIILVNDGSTDNSVKNAKDVLEKSKLSYKIINQKNQGVSSARNKGIENSNGKYIMFLDGDDYLKSKYLELMISKLEKFNLDAVFCGFDKVKENGQIIQKYCDKYNYINTTLDGKEVVEKMLKEKTWICTGNIIYKKSIIVYNDMKYSTELKYGEDQEFNIKVLLNCEKVTSVKTSLVNYLIRDGSAINSFSLKKFDVVKAYKNLLKPIKDKLKGDNKNRIIDLINSYIIPKSTMNILTGNFGDIDKHIFYKNYYRYKKLLIRYKIKYFFLDKKLFIKILLYNHTPSIFRSFLILIKIIRTNSV